MFPDGNRKSVKVKDKIFGSILKIVQSKYTDYQRNRMMITEGKIDWCYF